MKQTTILFSALFAIVLSPAAFAAGNYTCDNLNVISGQHELGVGYNVVVGVDYETQKLGATVYSRPVVPQPHVTEYPLDAQQQETRYFSKGTTGFTLSENELVGALSLNGGHEVFLCAQKPLTGAVTGHNN